MAKARDERSAPWRRGLRRLLPRGRRELADAGVLAVAYWAVAVASRLWLVAPDVGVVAWPAAGVALAALTLRGPRLWPGVFLGELAAALPFGPGAGLAGCLLGAGAAALAAALPAVTVRRRRVETNLTTLRAVTWLVVEGAAAGATLWALAAAASALMTAGADMLPLRRAFLLAWGGWLSGVLAVAPLALSWRPRGDWRLDAASGAHLAAAVAACAGAGYVIFLSPVLQSQRGWFLFPALVWPALVFSVRGASLALFLVAAQAVASDVLGIGAFAQGASRIVQTVLTEQFTAIASVTTLILAATADERRGREQLRAIAERLSAETEALEREIAERSRAEAHQRLLMNELNHRVKNTLATIQSMGAQSLRADRTPAEAREALESRLMALSAAHNLLTEERWETAELADVVRMAAAGFEDAPGERIAIEGPPVRLRAQHALSLAMALHELGSNAVKYGALSAPHGRVQVSWSLEPGPSVRFVWREHGGPPVRPPVRKGFGTRLIQEGLARELGGEARIDHLTEGVRCEISFPQDTLAPASDAADRA